MTILADYESMLLVHIACVVSYWTEY